MPDGFPSLSELKTDNFDYNISKGKVTVIADLEDPVRLLGDGMTIYDVKMTFKYNKNEPGGKWQFNAEGKIRDPLKFTILIVTPKSPSSLLRRGIGASGRRDVGASGYRASGHQGIGASRHRGIGALEPTIKLCDPCFTL